MLPGVLPRTADTDAFWEAFRRHAGLDHDNYVVGSFGDTPEMATELADLVIIEINLGLLPRLRLFARSLGQRRRWTKTPLEVLHPDV